MQFGHNQSVAGVLMPVILLKFETSLVHFFQIGIIKIKTKLSNIIYAAINIYNVFIIYNHCINI